MKLTKSVLVLAVLLVPAIASAQGYYGGGSAPSAQEPGGFHHRQGRLAYGGSIGLGGMSDRFGDIGCSTCDYNPVAVQIEGHIGGFVGPRFALLGEVQANIQTVSSNAIDGTTTLTQGALMLAGQYWVTPQLWIKGGIGFASLQLDSSYYSDGIIDASSKPENGVAIMGAIGYELLSARNFSVDLQGRLINGSYKQLDNNVTGASVGIGINWY